MHSMHHRLSHSFEQQRDAASTDADKAVSEFPDAERRGSIGVLLLRLPRRDSPSHRTAMLWPLRRPALLIALCAFAAACQSGSATELPPARRQAIADTLTKLLRSAYDLKASNPVQRFLSLYPDSGTVISASGGRVTTTRQALET